MLFYSTIIPQLKNLTELKDNGVSFKKKKKKKNLPFLTPH